MLSERQIDELRSTLIENLKNYDGEEKIKITYDLDTIREIIFRRYFYKKVSQNLLFDGYSLDYIDEYYVFAYESELMKKIDFTGISFDKFMANNIDFTGFYGVALNPETLYKQEIIDCKLNGVKIIGSLDRCKCANADFTGSIGGVMSKTHYDELKENNNLTDVQIIDEYGDVSDAIDRAFQMVKK